MIINGFIIKSSGAFADERSLLKSSKHGGETAVASPARRRRGKRFERKKQAGFSDIDKKFQYAKNSWEIDFSIISICIIYKNQVRDYLLRCYMHIVKSYKMKILF